MKIRNYKLKIVISTFVIFLLLSIANASDAAELKLTSQFQEFGVGQQFQVDLMLDTEGETINALEGEIVFPKELLEIKEIRDGDSIINLWVERPSINPTGTVVFSGIIPAGFEGVLSPYYQGYRPGKIFSLIFISESEGEGTVDFGKGRVLLHDGLGTPANLKISNFQFLISKDVSAFEFQVPQDTEPPESFVPEIARDPNIFEGKWFLVFATQDKGSGIDRYEIQETGRERFSAKKWIETESPYILKDQKLRSFVYVKAMDKAGNERIAVVKPRYPLKWYEYPTIWVIIISGIIVVVAIYRLFKLKPKTKNEKRQGKI